ncbi:TPA: OmpA family protein, partial [Escherichia coli]|nr:OmpA family protein [Escherichia coli]
MDKIIGKQLPKKDQDNEHWVSMSDLMAGLMMVFMFISIAYMHYVRIEKEKIKEVAVA